MTLSHNIPMGRPTGELGAAIAVGLHQVQQRAERTELGPRVPGRLGMVISP